jgi:heat shock protein 4
MSVVGFDLGNESCIVAVARQRGIDVVLNEESKRETPAIVCFGDKQRFIGTAGAASSTMNPKNSISQIKRLLGRKFSDPELQSDLASFPFRVTEGPDGFPLVHVRFLGEERTFTPTQLLAMVLSNLKGIAEGNLNAAVVDCCIGIPVYFSDLQRRAVLDAATIAGLRPLQLFHETTATALAYGIYKTDLPEHDQLNVAFVDVGHASMQVSIVGYKKGQLKMLSHAYDRSLGGRDFDEALFKHFAAKFKEEYKIDVYQNARACLRLRVACEKLKKVLSANPEAPLNIECLMDEKDVRGFIKRDEFEQISAPVLERVKGPLEKALAEAGLSRENVHFVEVVGSGSRVPAIIKIITEFFGKEPRRTMNASECVARGCALQCAILSPTFKVREFQVFTHNSSMFISLFFESIGWIVVVPVLYISLICNLCFVYCNVFLVIVHNVTCQSPLIFVTKFTS